MKLIRLPYPTRRDQLKPEFFEAKDLADKDPVLMPTDISGVVHPSQQKAFRIDVLGY